MIVKAKQIATFDGKNRIIRDGGILVEDGVISEVGSFEEIRRRNPSEEIEDLGFLVMPGLICAHCHAYGAFARGMPLKGAPPTNFVEILERIWWNLDKKLTSEDTYYSGLVTAIESLKHGTTSIFDHHASPYAITGSLDKLKEAYLKVGIRANIAYEVSDRDGPEKADEGIDENVRFIRANRGNDFVSGSFGLHASLTLSDETLEKCVEKAKDLDVGFHIHVAEDIADVKDSLRKSGFRVVERLWNHSVLGDKSIAAHCVNISSREIRILKETGAWVVHNPESNMNNAVGVAPVNNMMDAGVKVCLGTDGFTMDMFRESKVAFTLHKLYTADPRTMPAERVVEMFRWNSMLFKSYFPRPAGVIEKGAYADLIGLDYNPYTPMSSGNFPWHFIFGIDASNVKVVMVGGRIVAKNGRVLTVDEDEIYQKAFKLAEKLWQRL